MIKTVFLRMAAAAAIPAAVGLGALSYPALAQSLPNGNGKETVEMICSGCHDLAPITESIGFSKQDWETVVKSMIDMGATIKPEQVAVITTYLAEKFPPKQKQ